MDDNQIMLRDRINAMIHEVINAGHQKNSEDPASTALLAFLVRVAGSWRSVRILAESARGNQIEEQTILNDCAAIVRCMFDANIQAAYMCHDQSRKQQLGQLYWDYKIVERFRLAMDNVQRDNAISKRIANSRLRVEGEPQLIKDYERVRSAFQDGKSVTKSGKPKHSQKRRRRGIRKTWYEGDLGRIAETIGRSDEYAVLVKVMHGSIHSGPLALSSGPPFDMHSLVTLADLLVGRVAQLVVSNDDLTISEQAEEVVVALQRSPLGTSHGITG